MARRALFPLLVLVVAASGALAETGTPADLAALTVKAFTGEDPTPLLDLLAVQASSAVVVKDNAAVLANRLLLKDHPELADSFKLPKETTVKYTGIEAAGALQIIEMGLTLGNDAGLLTGAAVKERGKFVYTSLCLLPKVAGDDDQAAAADRAAVMQTVNQLASSLLAGQLPDMTNLLHPKVFSAVLSSPDGQFFSFGFADQLIALVNQFGQMAQFDESRASDERGWVEGPVVAMRYRWQVSAQGIMSANFRTLLHVVKDTDGFRVVGMALGSGGEE